MARSAGLQRRIRTCKRCGEHYTHTNRMERRWSERPVHGTLTSMGGWDALEAADQQFGLRGLRIPADKQNAELRITVRRVA